MPGREAAEKFGVSYNTLKDRAKREEWTTSREETHRKITAKTQQKIVEDEATNAAIMSRDEVLIELSRIARGGMKKVGKWGAGGLTLYESDTLDDDAAAIVSEVQETRTETGGQLKVKLYDKLSALDKLAKHYGLYQADGGENGNGSGKPTEPGVDLGAVDYSSLDAAELTHLYREAAKAPPQV